MKTGRKRPGRGTLGLLAAILLASAAVRMSTEAGAAFARDPALPNATATTAQNSSTSPDADTLIKALQERDARLSQREAQLADKMKAMTVAEEEISRKIRELKDAEAALSTMIALSETAAEDDITRLIKVYEAMKPKEAAVLFDAMDPEFAAGFLGRMQPELAAGILTGLPPQKAYSISAILAGRNVGAPTE